MPFLSHANFRGDSSSDRDPSHGLTRTYARDESYYMQDIEIVILVRRDLCVK
jgi:hypothetical protein